MPATTAKNISSTGKQVAKAKKHRVTIICRAKGSSTPTTVENVKASFKCPICGATLIYIAKERRLGGHGKAANSTEHELRKVQEVTE